MQILVLVSTSERFFSYLLHYGGGLHFDGRKDGTTVTQKRGAKYHTRATTEEHVSLV
jgi:hypothetical protein